MEATINKQVSTIRDSNLELYRIIVMLAVIAHHYVVNSGLMNCISISNVLSPNSLFLLLFGCMGKVAINCFVLITGYFMCKSNITLRKFLKLTLEWLFYQYVIYLIFAIAGYQDFSLNTLLRNLIPFYMLTDDFISCYIVFFLFIPFINILVHSMSKKQHEYLLILSLAIFSVWPSLPFVRVTFSYIFWFMILYLLSSYIRLYPVSIFSNTKFWGWVSLVALALSFISVIFMALIKLKFETDLDYYFFLADSNKVLAVASSICFFMFFKNIKIKYNPLINRIAASTFGVLCIHAASDTMRQWLWQDTFNNEGFFDSPYLVIHAIGTVFIVFVVCTLIDQLRIIFFEKPFFHFYDMQIEKHKNV